MALEPISPNSSAAVTYSRLNAALQVLSVVLTQTPQIFDRLTVLTNLQGADRQNIDYLIGETASVDAKLAALAATSGTDHDAIATLRTTLAQLADALIDQRSDFLNPRFRPGDNRAAFVLVQSRSVLSGDGKLIPSIPSAAVSAGDSGNAIRVTGAAIVAQRRPVPIEPARVYRARFVVQRRANASDPSNDSVSLGILWLDASLNIVAPTNDVTLVEDVRDLLTASGRQERGVAFSGSPSPDAQFRAPARARYARAYVQCYGLDGVTDIEVLGIEDVSAATVLPPATADTVQRVGALESQNAGQRLNALEANANAPNSVTFATKTDAASGQIPTTVTTVALRGLVQAGDGGDGIYKRISGAAPAGSDSFVNQGATFVRVFTSADVLGAALLSLPTTLPDVAGRAWLNGGILAVS